jgi:NAD(P)-dependent dehydrogenase (short-subunit alcohol dehydrogenase family)
MKTMNGRPLEGKVALVTGGAVRIGRALCLALAGQGASVAVHYGSSTEAALETVTAIRGMGVRAESFKADLRNITAIDCLIRQAVEQFGNLDILVNSAAVFHRVELGETTEAVWAEQFAVNLRAPFFLARDFAAHVGRERTGQIINIADWRGARPDPSCPAYSMTKSGILSMTEALALFLAPNIRVNAIAPGAVLPPPGLDMNYLNEAASKSPLGKVCALQQLADALLYLVMAESVTGQVIFVDGGRHLGSRQGPC